MEICLDHGSVGCTLLTFSVCWMLPSGISAFHLAFEKHNKFHKAALKDLFYSYKNQTLKK